MVSTVYRITCSVNGKYYIGVTSQSARDRFNAHIDLAAKGRDTRLYRAIRRHGQHSFELDVLEICESLSIAKMREICYINLYQSFTPRLGYNMTLGGDGSVGFRHSVEAIDKMKAKRKTQVFSEDHLEKLRVAGTGRIHTLEARKKMSDALRGRTLSREHRAKISSRRKGAVASTETKKKLSEKRKGKSFSEEHKKNLAESIRQSWIKRRAQNVT